MNPIEFPRPETKAKIAALPKFNADVSVFANMLLEDAVDWAKEQVGDITVNASEITPGEIEFFTELDGALSVHGKKVVLFDEKVKVAEITREIASDMVDLNVLRKAFKAFVLDVLENDPEAFVAEWNTYFADPERKNTYDTADYWKNLGLADPVDSLRTSVTGLIDEVLDSKIGDGEETVLERFESEIIPDLKPVPGVDSVREKGRSLGLAMFSNMDRGVMYNESDTSKVYGMRKLAVEHIEEALADQAVVSAVDLLIDEAERDLPGMVRGIMSAADEGAANGEPEDD
jgi:hypothetical protein